MVNLSSELYTLFDADGSHIVTFLAWLGKTYQLPDNLHVLDVGCGPGRLLKQMANRGWQVVAMEPNPQYRESAMAIASEIENIRVIDGGFMDITQENTYDLVIAINAPFAYLTTIEERVEALQRIFLALKPNGVVFLDVPNFLYMLKNFRTPAPTITESPQGDLVRRVIEQDVDFHDCTFTHIDSFYVNDELVDKQVHTMSFITLTEILYLLKQANFDEIMTFNNFGERESQQIMGIRMLISARKS